MVTVHKVIDTIYVTGVPVLPYMATGTLYGNVIISCGETSCIDITLSHRFLYVKTRAIRGASTRPGRTE